VTPRRGVVAAGHPLTAETGAEILREGGNAIDAAVAAMMASFSLESALTGLGAGGFMIVGGPDLDPVVFDFFVAAPGAGGHSLADELRPVPVHFDEETTQVFNVGPASCGVPGTAAGIQAAVDRFGSAAIGDLVGPGIRFAREGAPLNHQQAYVLRILEPIYTATPAAREIYAPQGRILGEGELFRYPDLALALERFAEEGADSIYGGEVAGRMEEYVCSRGGTLSAADLAAYQVVERKPVGATFEGREVLTNPPPSAGGILIAFCLALLERMDSAGTVELAEVMAAANSARSRAFAEGLGQPGFAGEFLSDEMLARALGASDGLGSTTHLSVMDADGMCASVTCSNGTGSGLVVPGTGIHLNNMLGEEDLNPLGFHADEPGARIGSMMAPTLILERGEVLAGLGSAGSNRIRSAILQTIVNLLAKNMEPQAAVDAPRIHLESDLLQAEPGVDPAALELLASAGVEVFRWRERNLFFGGVQVVTRSPESGSMAGGGDPRRGGAVALA
jgi:gamma-glutamyltranspeptidase/glutathione hydrolase